MSGGTVGPVDEAQLDALVGRYEWFTPARILRVLQTGRSDRRVSIAAVSRLLPFACRPDRPFPEGGGASDRGRGGRSR